MWPFKKKREVEPAKPVTLATMMRDIVNERIEANKMDLDLQSYIDKIQAAALAEKTSINFKSTEFKLGQVYVLRQSLQRLGFRTDRDASEEGTKLDCLSVYW